MVIIELTTDKCSNALLYISCIEECLCKLKSCLEHCEETVSTESESNTSSKVVNRYE